MGVVACPARRGRFAAMPAHRPVDCALAQLRQLACLDAGGPELIAPVLDTLHQVLGFDSGGYVYPRSDGELDVYMENPALRSVVPEYFEPHILRSEQQVLVRSSRLFDEAVRCERGVQMLHQLIKVPEPELRRSDFYNAIMRPGEADDVLSLALRTPQGQGIGILKLYRRSGDPPFSPADAARLAPLEAGLARVLAPRTPGAADGPVCGEGLLVLTPLGRVQWASPLALELMALAFGARWRGADRGALPPAVQPLLQRLQLPGPPPGTGDTRPAQLALGNAQGWFCLRATPLHGTGCADQAVALHITRRLSGGARAWAALE